MIADEVDVGSPEILAPGTMMVVSAAGVDVLVVNDGGEFLSVQPTCSHEDYALVDGDLGPGTITCPAHFSRFDLRTGAVIDTPAVDPLATFRVRVQEGRLLVAIPREARSPA